MNFQKRNVGAQVFTAAQSFCKGLEQGFVIIQIESQTNEAIAVDWLLIDSDVFGQLLKSNECVF
ncbi:hypothetical protein D3C71_1822310 [compost metagenome]